MEEIKLIEQAKLGNTNCFSQLVILHQDNLYQYLLARCKNSFDASDVLQETFINAFKYLNSYQSKWVFKTWIFTIATRLIKKQNKLYQYRSEPLVINESVELEEIEINKSNIWNKIQCIIKKEAFDVLWFYYVEELSTKEISYILKQSQAWVKITLFRTKKILAKNDEVVKLSKHYFIVGVLL
jgi:RNA polymerase sigma-70 factor (ECF subfamily)